MNDLHQSQSPLNWEASATTTNPEVLSSLPAEVEACLKNARFVRAHLPFPLDTHQSQANRTALTAPSRNMRQLLPPRLPHELHLPRFHPIYSLAQHHHDHQPVLEENHQPHQEPARLDLGS